MTAEFYVGQEVVCVDDGDHPEWLKPNRTYELGLDGLTKGRHYIIRDIAEILTYEDGSYLIGTGEMGLRLKEIVRHPPDQPYRTARFRPVKAENIEVFRQMCVDAPKYAKVKT
jgi:hypothetical protein